MFRQFKFIIEHIKSIALSGAVLWLLVILTLDLFGVVDVQAECPICAKMIEAIIPKAFAGTVLPPVTSEPLLRVRFTVLP